jgi:hypothetical protein
MPKRTDQSSLGLSFSHKFVSPDISLLEVTTAIFDSEGADIAVTIEPLILGVSDLQATPANVQQC